MNPQNDPPTVYHGSARVGDPVPPARWAAFGRTLLRGHQAMADGRCGCGQWRPACEVRLLARRQGIPVDPYLPAGPRVPRR